MHCIGLIKPRNTKILSPKSLFLFSLSLQLFSMPQEQETLGFLASRSIEGRKSRGGARVLSPSSFAPPIILPLPLLQPSKHQVQDLKSLSTRLVQVSLRSGVDLRSFEVRVRSPSIDLQERLQQDRSVRSISNYLLPYLEYPNLRSIN